MKIAVFAKAGSIPHRRWVRLTGSTDPNGAFECDIVGPGQRAHALLLEHPTKGITPTVPGYAEAMGSVLPVEAGTAFAADVELRSNADGTVSKAVKGDFTVGVSITSAAKGATVPMLIRWGVMD